MFCGIFLFKGALTLFSSGGETNKKYKSLVILCFACSVSALIMYFSTRYRYTSPFLLMIYIATATISVWAYITSVQDYLSFDDRTLEMVKKILLAEVAITICIGTIDLITGSQMLTKPGDLETSNILLSYIDSPIQPTEFIWLVAGINVLCLFYALAQFSKVLVAEKHYTLLAGAIVTLMVNINDGLIMLPNAEYLLQMAFFSYFIEAVHLTVKYQKKAILEIHRLETELTHASKIAQMGYTVGQIMHDIKNPLTVIRGLASTIQMVIKDVKEASRAEQMVDGILKHVDRISNISDDYLNRMHKQSNSSEVRILNISDVISEAVDLTSPKISQANLPSVKISCDEDLYIEAVENELVMAFVNLISNGVDAIEPLSEKWIEISAKISGKNRDHIKITVTDSGKGIAPSIANKIFESNFSTKERGKGTGLGLAFVKKVFEKYGGTITISQECDNTRFLIKLKSVSKNKIIAA